MPSLTISLSGDNILIHLPSSRNRTLEVSCNEIGLATLKKLLIAQAMIPADKQDRGGLYPTQHLVNKWMKEERPRIEAERREAERERLSETIGFDISILKIDI